MSVPIYKLIAGAWRAARPAVRLALLAGLLALPVSAWSATPADLYGATVPAEGSDQKSLNAAFDRALAQVLIKVTGQPEAASLRRELFPDSRRLLLQYRRVDEDSVFAAFDGTAIRNALDATGQPVWGEQRPLVAVWLAVDAGGGRRYILSDGSQDSDEVLADQRAAVLDAASARGLPVVLPLLDAADMSVVSFSDVWGGFIDRMASASTRYGSEALLIGRTDTAAPDAGNVRWAFTYAGEQADWRGSLADGPGRAADLLARQDATTAASADRIRLAIAGVNSIAGYGELTRYLKSLNMVADVAVAAVANDRIEFELMLRGDPARLRQVLANSRLLSAADAGQDPRADYRYMARP